MALDARPIKQNAATFFTTTVSEATSETPLSASTNRKLLNLWLHVEGTGTTDVDIYHGTSSSGTRIARYRNTAVPTGVIDLLPGLGASGGASISSGLYIFAGQNKNSSVLVSGLHRTEGDG